MSKQTFIVGVDTDKKSFEEWIAEHDAKVRAEAIDEINNREKNIPYSDFARGFKSGYEKGQMIIAEHDAKVRADERVKVLEEVKNKLYEIGLSALMKPQRG